MTGHNRLLGSYDGTDGIKTGYINASGFNLVSSVRRGDKRLVGVVLGGRTGASRDAYMKQMLTQQFRQGQERQDHRRHRRLLQGRGRRERGGQTLRPRPAQKKERKTAAAKRLKKQGQAAAAAGAGARGTGRHAGRHWRNSPRRPQPKLHRPRGRGGAAASRPCRTRSRPRLVGRSAVPGEDPASSWPTRPQVASISPAPDAGWFITLGDYATKNDAQAILQQLRKRAPEHARRQDGADCDGGEGRDRHLSRPLHRLRRGIGRNAPARRSRSSKAPCQPQGPS